ncbi:DinB family protein [Streptomyces sp. TR06-5]|uniref:DinB family protein n=1 Tax=unclassified Streptomyces TaxID=2593676 RepID=UPI0039A07BAE
MTEAKSDTEPCAETDAQGRPEPPHRGDEAATLLGFLEHQRATLEWKCRGLGDEALRTPLPPTSMTLGGLLKHLALVEDHWCTEVVAGEELPSPWHDVDWRAEPDWEWHSAAEESGEGLRRLWAERVERSRAVVAARLAQDGPGALDVAHAAWGGRDRVSLRWVLTHLIEEYARHNGHADLLREAVDGSTGE